MNQETTRNWEPGIRNKESEQLKLEIQEQVTENAESGMKTPTEEAWNRTKKQELVLTAKRENEYMENEKKWFGETGPGIRNQELGIN